MSRLDTSNGRCHHRRHPREQSPDDRNRKKLLELSIFCDKVKLYRKSSAWSHILSKQYKNVETFFLLLLLSPIHRFISYFMSFHR